MWQRCSCDTAGSASAIEDGAGRLACAYRPSGTNRCGAFGMRDPLGPPLAGGRKVRRHALRQSRLQLAVAKSALSQSPFDLRAFLRLGEQAEKLKQVARLGILGLVDALA